MRHRLSWIWGGRIMAAVVVAGLIAYLSWVGLDKADELASVLSLLVAVVALVAPYLLPSSDGRASGSGSTQSVANAVVGKNLTQVRGAGNIRVGSQMASESPQPTTPTAGRTPEIKSGQYVNGVWVGGNLTQIDDADGDVTIG